MFSADHTGGHRRVIFPPPPPLRCCLFACCNAAASVSVRGTTVVSPTSTNQTPGARRLAGSSGAFSSSTVAGARATCRINGNNFPFDFHFSSLFSLTRASTPTASLFVALPPTARVLLSLSGAARALVPLRLRPALAELKRELPATRVAKTPERVPRAAE